MSQFLFVVEVPPGPQGASEAMYSHAWREFSNAAIALLKPLKGTKQLQLNAWLLTAENSLPAMAELSALAGHHKLAYSSLLLPVDAVIIAHDVKPKP